MNVDIGVDLAATRLAAVLLFGKERGDHPPFRVETRTMPKEPVDRAYAAFTWIARIVSEVQDGNDVAVYVEKPVLGRGGAGGTLPIAMIQGAVFAGAKRAGANLIVGVDNQTWKKRVCGKGGISKAEVAAFIRTTWPALFAAADGSQDVADAGCIALHGRQIREMKRRTAVIRARRTQA